MIRRMECCDVQRAGDIWLEASIRAHDFVPAEFWRSKLDLMVEELLPGADGYVHISDAKIDGFATVEDDFIHCLFVDPELQGHGIGSSLLYRLQAEHATLRLKVYQRNKGAREFYEARGFRVCGESECPHTGCAEFEMEWVRNNDSSGAAPQASRD